MSKSTNIADVVALLADARTVVFLTGAGISAESGIPTFRDAQTGLWAKYNPEDLATPSAFKRNPDLVWQWYDHRRRMLDAVEPNAGHYAIAELEKHIDSIVVITQNVDGLHKRSGSRDVLELHGNITSFYCFDHKHPAADVAKGLPSPPRCHCGSLIRPAVVWFNEQLDEDVLSEATDLVQSCDVVFVAGTSSIVQPAASLPYLSIKTGIPVIEINLDDTPLTPHAAVTLNGKSGEILPQIVSCLVDSL